MAESLAKRIIKYRGKHNLSMQKFADKCGINLQTVFRIETGKREKPSRLTTMKILKVIGEDKDEIV